MLSCRGTRKATQPLRPDFALFDRAMENPYSSDQPDGAITLCIAENLLQWDVLREKLQDIAASRPWPEWIAAYAPLGGHPDFRTAVARFVGKHIARRELKPDNFCASAGATAVIELTALALGDPGDCAVFPAPAYQAYLPDINSKAGLERYDITTYINPGDGQFHPLSVADLDAARAELGGAFRLLVLTQPDNPTGAVYSARQLEAITDWCIDHRVHLVVNEIYALSQFLPEAVRNNAPFTSFLPLLERRDSPYLHWWYSFSKDFGISGFRVGLLYTRNGDLRSAYANFNAPHQISNLTQWLLAEVLNDDSWVTAYQKNNQLLLTEAYTTVTDALDGIGVPYAPARGSLFVWADFSRFLSRPTTGEAEVLWNDIFERTGVLLTAPGGLGQPTAGWYRIVYSCVRPEALKEAMRRITAYFA
ncbi:aminotransferase class I/II-fold pyridoxal phosphate-dependent enzyme [Lewinella sp. JB7]|uniref:aminotransferase class I/II-fold pyridoxal phosphate-dependent enzyme n=1 Tax=Lewinella sp. JB7 TaxID=2962887 RepID=UPI0020C9516A|nr:aminotransferase class I/II-fold pyridoxal phosphate-dependent enzyme [Lewinella sp. JB7]MCP9234944.1 aminotransferase class I/II-fold pyridoxal phosphate-dependent enzyme [Lewinella sp. JB7]